MDLLKKYFELSSEQESKFELFQDLFKEWNVKLNLISRKDLDHLEERHILHSLAIVKLTKFKPGTKIMDLGCGGGFPGLMLAIYFPEVDFYLVDSIAKKIKAVDGMAVKLDLNNVRASHARAEQIDEKFDFVVSRAVAPMNKLWAWSRNKIKKDDANALSNGLIALKGGDLKLELNPFGRRVLVEDISKHFEEEFFETKKLIYLRA